jgi:hypothetical protein
MAARHCSVCGRAGHDKRRHARKRAARRPNPMGIVERAALRRRVVSYLADRPGADRAQIERAFGALPDYPNFGMGSLRESAADERVYRLKADPTGARRR